MPGPTRQRVAPTDDWQQLRLHLDWPEQVTYELIRPVVVFGHSVVQRAIETGAGERTIRRKADQFDALGMASLFPAKTHSAAETADRREIPRQLRQLLTDLKAAHPAFRAHELATIGYVVSGRRLDPRTVQRILTSGLPPSRTTRRYVPYREIDDPVERRLAIVRLHTEGWNTKSIAAYLQTTRRRVYETLERWIKEGVCGLDDKPPVPKQPQRKVDLRTMRAVQKLQENPELGEFRMHAALLQLGIELSPRTCGRILALNRSLYLLPGPTTEPHEPKPMPFQASRRHQYWTVDVRYLDMHQLGGGMIYVISILENYSRCILASMLSRSQDLTAYLMVLYAAIRRYGNPEALVSDGGAIFKATRAMTIYQTLGITKEQIDKRQAWQSYIESQFNVQRRMADWHFARATTWEELLAVHDRWLEDFNTQVHWAHREREDGRHSPAEVLGWVTGTQHTQEELHRIFYTTRFARRLDKLGYARFRHWRIYGEHGLARQYAAVWLYGDLLTIEFADSPLSQYLVTYTPNHIQLRTVAPLRQFQTPHRSPQMSLWELQPHEWQLALSLPIYGRQRKPSAVAIQRRLAL
jgi:putative transposase